MTQLNRGRYLRRLTSNYLSYSFSILAMAFGLFWLGWILWTLLQLGLPGMHWITFTKMTAPPGSTGGLLNAIVGSVLMIGCAIAIGAPVGMLAGAWLAEFGHNGRWANIIRFLNDVLLSAPSIIIGLFIYQIYVVPTQHFSGWAGCCALAILVIPVVMRTTEEMFLLIPTTLREAAAALGAPQWKVITFIVLQVARTGILTGILLALARISGETAPLLFTALNNQFWSLNLNQPLANLPTIIFQYAMSPYDDWHQLAWTGALLITLWVLGINILVRVIFKQKAPLH
jgi:phosphate transport system permease protein